MATRVIFSPDFEKDIKHLKRKYPAVLNELEKLVDQLENDERVGDKIPNVGHDVYKVRLPNPSAARGKSGGFRVIYYIKLADTIYIISVYSKTEQVDISVGEIRQLIENLDEESGDDIEE